MCVKEGVFLLFLLILFWIVVLKGIRFVDFGFLQAQHCTQARSLPELGKSAQIVQFLEMIQFDALLVAKIKNEIEIQVVALNSNGLSR